jgi:hypothetical protein
MRTRCADCANSDGFDEDSRKSPRKSPQPGPSISVPVDEDEKIQGGWTNNPETLETREIRRLRLEIERASQDPAVGLPQEFEP